MATRGTRTAALLTAPLALIGVGATPAVAGETERFSYSDCEVLSEDGQLTLCYTVEGSVHSALTPSGIESYVVKAELSEQLLGPDGEVLASASFRDKYRSLIKDGEWHVFTLKSKATTNYDGQTCEITFHVHESNGEVRIDRWDMTCV